MSAVFVTTSVIPVAGGLFCENATISHCKIIQNAISYLGGNSSSSEYRACGMGVVSVNSTFSNSLIYDNSNDQGSPYNRYSGGMVASVTTLINCNIVGNKGSMFAGGVNCTDAGNTFMNCVIWGNDGNNVYTTYNNNNHTYARQTFSHCAIEISVNNNLNLDETNIILDSENNGFPGGGVWCPNFSNPDNGDFTLKPASALINGGTTDGIILSELDLNGNSRLQQNSIDIGCYEFTKNGTYGYNGIVYVKANGAGDSTGTSWTNAMPDLQTAVNTAYVLGDGCQVWVAAGIYYGNRYNIGDRTDHRSAFTMKEGVNVYGGFVGNEPASYDLSQRNHSTNATILDGQQLRRVVVQHNEFDTQTTWDGFTIRNGMSMSRYWYEQGIWEFFSNGGGCYLSGNAVLSHCDIYDNSTSTSNFSGGPGGGVWAKNSTLSFCKIHNNTLADYDGGGVYVDSCIVVNCKVYNNTCNGHGGGIYSFGSEFINCEISNNTSYNGAGGGVYTIGAPSSFVNCDIVNNKAEQGVGGVACWESFLWDYDYEEEEYYSYKRTSFTNCVIWGNKRGNNLSNITNPNRVRYYDGHATMKNTAVEGGYDGENNIALASTNDGGGTFFPRFVSPTAGAGAAYTGGDWRLLNNSVLINRGDTAVVGLPLTDLAGNSRVQQGRIDIGCYESASQGISMPDAPGPIIYVTQNGAGSRDGSSWSNAMSNLDWAVSLASMYDSVQVWVATGLYHGNTSADNAFTMRENVNVYGGFAGNEPANFDLSQRDLSANPTVLDGQNSRMVLYQLCHFRHVTEWDGFVLRNGYAPNGSNIGGAILKANGKLNHCSIHNNNGYAVIGFGQKNNIGYGQGFVSNCLIRNNSLGVNGGTYTNCSIVANGGEGASAGNFKNCILWGNEEILSNTYYTVFSRCAVEGGYGSGYITLESANDGTQGFYPRFVSPTAGAGINYNGGDWRLQNGSVCINNGDTSGLDISSKDLAGNSRVQHGQIDIGCYESSSNDMVTLPLFPHNIVYVTQTGAGNMDGSSWGNAMADIKQAVTYAAIYDSVNVWVAAGTYYGDTSASSTEEASANAFHMRDGVQVYGGFAGNESANYNLSLRDFTTNVTILDGQNLRRVLLQNNDFRFKSEWDGFTLQNGYAPWNGAGCYLRDNGVLNHCVISNNTISFQGGGGVVLNGPASLLNCTIRNNNAMMSYYDDEHNSSSNGYSDYNTAGGVYHYPGDYGYEEYGRNHNATIKNCIISNNNGSYCGGVLLRGVDMSGCLISNNSGTIGGGLIRNIPGGFEKASTVTNCDIVNNKSMTGFVGGVFHNGLESEDYYYGDYDTLSFVNCIIWGNKSNGQISNIGQNGTTLASFKYCAVEGSSLGNTNLPLLSENEGNGYYHPRFVAPSAGAGVDYSGGNWQLQEGSICINRGDTDGIEIAELDMAGNPRIQQGRIDIGCYESPFSDSTAIVCDTVYKDIYGSSCKSFTWNGVTYTTSGDYSQYFQNNIGCDSVVTLHLIIIPADTVITFDTLCGGVRATLINAPEEYLQNNYYVYSHSSDTCQVTYLYNNSIDNNDGITIIDVDGEFWNGTYYNLESSTTIQHDAGCDTTYIQRITIKFSDEITTWDTGCGLYIWDGDTIAQSGTYEHTFINSLGCESMRTLNLHMRPSVYEVLADTACDNYTLNGITYFESGIYTQSLDVDVVIQPDEMYYEDGGWWWYDEEYGEGWSASETVTIPGCKLTTLHLTINHSVTNSFEVTACDSYTWNDNTYTTSGEYIQTFTSANGCDSTVTLQLTVNESKHTNITAENCGSYTWNETTYTTSGEYTQTFTAVNGCDSTVTLQLTILPLPTPNITGVTTVCEGQTATLNAIGGVSYLWEDGTTTNTYPATVSGLYTVTVTNAEGCSAMASTTVTVNPLPEVVITGNTTICPGGNTILTATGADSYQWSNGSTNPSIPVNMFGQYSVIGTSAAGCFSTASVTVLVSQPPVITISGNTDICAGESTTLTANGGVSYMWSNGSTADTLVATTAGTWQVIGYNVDGCSNMASVTVNLWQPATTNLYITSFDSCYMWFGTPRCESGDYTHTLQTIHGCDSVIILHLTLEDAITTEFSATSCDSYTWNGITYSQSGNYTQNFTAVNGNDSIVTLHLTINYSVSEVVEVTACDSYEWNGQTYTSSGNYTQTLIAANECDSVVTLNLTVNSSVSEVVEATACDSYLWNDSNYTVSGDYIQIFTAANGCDSVVTLHLTINHPVAEFVETTVCDSYEWNGQSYVTSGDYTQTFTAANGCDSVVTLHLIVNDTKHVEFADSTCTTYTWNGQSYAQSGDYTQNFTAANGCDSVVTLHLTIVPTITPVIAVNGSLTACGNGSATLTVPGNYSNFVWSTGAVSSALTVNEAGYYWVTATDVYGCEGVSEMVQLGGSVQIDETPAICMVGVDNDHNLVVWEPLTDPDVSEYRIYREDGQANIFEPLAVIPASNSNAYVDATADPSVRAYRYKITAADTCGGETPMSAFHKTVHLTINQGLGNSYNLIWTPYEGFEFSSYKLYRGTANNNLQLIQTMPSTLTSYTDNNPAGDALFYQIEVVMTESCVQQTRDITYTGARSNIVYNGVAVTTEVTIEACDSYDWNGQILTSSGDYTQNFVSELGYDSVVTLHLTINPSVTEVIEVTTPDSCYTWNGQDYCTSGTYTQTLQTVHGCDSVVTMHLTITVGVNDYDGFDFKVYPNPTTGVVNVQITNPNSPVTEFHVYDAYGKLIRVVDVQTVQIDLSHYASGVYFIKAVADGNVVAVRKVVKN